jgi:hypothetical protein
MLGVGIWFLLLKPHIIGLILLAVVLYAWRNRMLFKTMLVVGALAVVSSVVQPLWVADLATLTLERLKNPRMLDSVLLLPGYPFAQLALLTIGAVLLCAYFVRSAETIPTKWLWCVLVTTSLIAGLHTVPYDWLNLMLPLALLMRQRWGVWLTTGLYMYPLFWGALWLGLEVNLISPTVIPSVVLGALLVDKLLWRPQVGADRAPVWAKS